MCQSEREENMKTRTGPTLVLAMAAAAMAAYPTLAAENFMDVGKQAPITILINASPWYNGFESVVNLYEQQTGNKVNLDVTPFPGMLE
jgi:multiple sugar transport system substrate-binding protein